MVIKELITHHRAWLIGQPFPKPTKRKMTNRRLIWFLKISNSSSFLTQQVFQLNLKFSKIIPYIMKVSKCSLNKISNLKINQLPDFEKISIKQVFKLRWARLEKSQFINEIFSWKLLLNGLILKWLRFQESRGGL